ncbi:MAG: 3-dehydroquinate synthase [Deltaproteobacteria bacterium]
MKTISVELKDRSYRILVGRQILASLGGHCRRLGLGTDAFCVTNPTVKARYGKRAADSLRKAGFGVETVTVADSEKSKSFAVCSRLLGELARFDRQKRVFIVALGGGVVGDLAGFSAAIYKRGIPYVQVPTTLLAQVDSSIGGKTAVDLPEGKNLAGSFYQPRLVLSDISLLASLDARQISSGMAEAVKYGIISDPVLFSLIEKKGAGPLERIVAACSRIKAGIVSRDEREAKGLRVILNFGHTVGHALEAASGYSRYAHGEAVSVGMACACDISVRLGMLDGKAAGRIERVLTRLGLPTSFRGTSPGSLMGPLLRDKKFKGKNRFVLLRAIGSPEVVEDVPIDLVRDVVEKRVA